MQTGDETIPSAVLFDLDGTVWDSLSGIVSSLAHALAHVGVPVPSDEVLASNVGPPLLVMLAHFGVAEERLEEAKDAYRDHYRRVGEFQCEVYPGVASLLDDLRAEGIRLATATSKGVDPTRRMLAHFDLERRFDVIAAASMDSSAAHKVDVIAAALAELTNDGSSTIVIVGDRHFDIDGGAAFGLRTIGVEWGYGSRAELESAGAHHVATTVDELGRLLVGR
ncbi:MAG TPA: HAD hydrolase-like protein [Microthrixaceae bacterium]|nr:HAD hydrolase-like protein [Microthrixaceae bacterium]